MIHNPGGRPCAVAGRPASCAPLDLCAAQRQLSIDMTAARCVLQAPGKPIDDKFIGHVLGIGVKRGSR
ncbi:MAG: hypothetical protein M9895_04865 [Aquamicrobium sp.]|uniref:hypothetical protein n=1 Tax=Aquamicrobium sp. TaxID=1872579 RepID=UPI00349E501A|nr:hypothetical protein [Aquamicrobium sp.]